MAYKALNLLRDLSHLARATGHETPATEDQAIYAVYFIAIALGFTTGMMLYSVIVHIASALFEYRKDRLLVECWDALSNAEKTRLQQSSR